MAPVRPGGAIVIKDTVDGVGLCIERLGRHGRRAGARRLSITKEWCYGPHNAPPASGHCPYSRPAPKPNRRGRPPVSARIARRLDELLERVALLPIGEPPRPQVRPADKPYSIAFLCSYACLTNSLSRIYVRASTVI